MSLKPQKIADCIAVGDSEYAIDQSKAPWDSKPVLVKWSAGWWEAWWCAEDWMWIALDDNLQFELDDVSHWTPLPEIDE